MTKSQADQIRFTCRKYAIPTPKTEKLFGPDHDEYRVCFETRQPYFVAKVKSFKAAKQVVNALFLEMKAE